jgi:hypothetical protein
MVVTSYPNCNSLANNGITYECASKSRYKYSTESISTSTPRKHFVPLYHHAEGVWNVIAAHTYFNDEKRRRKWPEAHR